MKYTTTYYFQSADIEDVIEGINQLKISDMINFLPHTDLTNPEKYHNMMNRNMVLVERPYDRTYLGVIHTTFSGYKVNFCENGKYFIEDTYGNSRYLSNWNNRMIMFELINSNDFQLCSDIEEIDVLIRKFFKRKLY